MDISRAAGGSVVICSSYIPSGLCFNFSETFLLLFNEAMSSNFHYFSAVCLVIFRTLLRTGYWYFNGITGGVACVF
jgi:hypothetical protein